MASTIKAAPLTPDSMRERAGATGSLNVDARRSQPTDAMGAEIPVIVHASRYSAATKNLGKNLAPVHEETRTVIVFPQGTVVRLSSTLELGELVVLTNKQTGADVICRVTNVKAQPGIQNYVHLEFTQRAPGFWGESGPSERSSISEMPAPATLAPSTPAAAATREQAQVAPLGQPVRAIQSVPAKPSTEELEIVEDESAGVELPPTWLELGTQTGGRVQSQTAASPTPSGGGVRQTASFLGVEPKGAQLDLEHVAERTSSSKPKKLLLIALAAVVLLCLGALGGTLLVRQSRPQPLPVPSAQTAPAPPVNLASTATPVANAIPNAAKTGSLVSTAEAPKSNSAAEAAPSASAAVVSAPEPVKVASAPARPKGLGKISAPVAKSPVVTSASEPPPVLPMQTGGALNESLLNASARGSALVPATPAPVKGGQLQQPRLISSAAAVYPQQARADLIQGDVVIDLLIDATGKVTNMQVISGHPLLQRAAMDAVRQWKYEPARLNGQPISISTKVSVTFRLH
jgi:periplasmic protein TonB